MVWLLFNFTTTPTCLHLKPSPIPFVFTFQIWFQESKLKAARMNIYVRRGGPNYQTGLTKMRTLGAELGVPIEVWLLILLSQKRRTCRFLKWNHRDQLHASIPITDDLTMLKKTRCRCTDQRRPWLGSARKPLNASWLRKPRYSFSHCSCTRFAPDVQCKRLFEWNRERSLLWVNSTFVTQLRNNQDLGLGRECVMQLWWSTGLQCSWPCWHPIPSLFFCRVFQCVGALCCVFLGWDSTVVARQGPEILGARDRNYMGAF